MRLINTKDLKFEEHFEPALPAYAIFSHRWGADEVTFQEFDEVARSKGPRFRKIQKLRCQAVRDGIGYVWIDTCCIDKTNSVELSEAINSMFKWYMNAAICYAFLADYRDDTGLAPCTLFERGWALQELVAPARVRFFDDDMNEICTRDSRPSELEGITGVAPQYMGFTFRGLEKVPNIWPASVAARMSWASRRKVTKEEDVAYCLLGVFDVNMPLLYGEGPRKAFVRLQHAIIAQSDDESLFAWTSQYNEVRGMLARDPSEFATAMNIVPHAFRLQRPPYTLTNHGLEFHRLPRSLLRRIIVPGANRLADADPVLTLQCVEQRPGLPLQRVAVRLVRAQEGVWARAESARLVHCDVGKDCLDTIYPGGWFKMQVATGYHLSGAVMTGDSSSLAGKLAAHAFDVGFLVLWSSAAFSWCQHNRARPVRVRDVMETCLLLMTGWKWTGLSYVFLTTTFVAITAPEHVTRFGAGAWLRRKAVLGVSLLNVLNVTSRWTVMLGVAVATFYGSEDAKAVRTLSNGQ